MFLDVIYRYIVFGLLILLLWNVLPLRTEPYCTRPVEGNEICRNIFDVMKVLPFLLLFDIHLTLLYFIYCRQAGLFYSVFEREQILAASL